MDKKIASSQISRSLPLGNTGIRANDQVLTVCYRNVLGGIHPSIRVIGLLRHTGGNIVTQKPISPYDVSINDHQAEYVLMAGCSNE